MNTGNLYLVFFILNTESFETGNMSHFKNCLSKKGTKYSFHKKLYEN